jgi:hypothetical protein
VILPFRLLTGAAVLFILVVALGHAVTAGHFRAFDLAISHALNMQRGVSPDWLIVLMQGISWIGDDADCGIDVGRHEIFFRPCAPRYRGAA